MTSGGGAADRVPWVLISGGFHQRGGMDRANAALAEHLLEAGHPVHLVAHGIDPRLAAHPAATAHLVSRPAGSYLAGEHRLARRGWRVAAEVTAADPRARVVTNGGNCRWRDVNWVHCVHAVWPPADVGAPLWFRVKNRLAKALARREERRAIPGARRVVANSQATRRALIDRLGAAAERVVTVYPGADPGWRPASIAERAAARGRFGLAGEERLAVFVGALGYDRNKGFDTLLAAWERLAARPAWTARLVAAGGGTGLELWRREVDRCGLSERVRLLGFTDRIGDLLAAADLLVAPSRYEAFGLAVLEAACREVPVVVSAGAGVAERLGTDLEESLLPDATDADDLAARLLAWSAAGDLWRRRMARLAPRLRSHTWDDMARQILDLAAPVDGRA